MTAMKKVRPPYRPPTPEERAAAISSRMRMAKAILESHPEHPEQDIKLDAITIPDHRLRGAA
jgi:hypothetical protein